jgi:3-oxoacyl-[acyl-carrier protein] reductase
MNLDIEGRTALILGAGGGLGSAISTALAREGVRVALADLDAAAAQRTAEAVGALGGKCVALRWDLADLSIIDDNVAAIERELGTVDILVNNTGGPPPGPAAGVPADTWTKQFESMVLPVVKITDRVLPRMRERGWGRIVTSASSGVVAPIPNLALSNALRLSLVGWSKSLAREVAPHGVTSNVVIPGRIGTDRIRFLDESKAQREGRPVEDVIGESTAAIPAGRYGSPDEYADAVVFLASQRASYITGSVIRVDGGYIPSI